jgi:hypothetical protein
MSFNGLWAISLNGLSIPEVPSEARYLGEGVARTRYTLLSECDSTEQSKGLRRVLAHYSICKEPRP